MESVKLTVSFLGNERPEKLRRMQTFRRVVG